MILWKEVAGWPAMRRHVVSQVNNGYFSVLLCKASRASSNRSHGGCLQGGRTNKKRYPFRISYTAAV
jgi:hypothetical protein